MAGKLSVSFGVSLLPGHQGADVVQSCFCKFRLFYLAVCHCGWVDKKSAPAEPVLIGSKQVCRVTGNKNLLRLVLLNDDKTLTHFRRGVQICNETICQQRWGWDYPTADTDFA